MEDWGTGASVLARLPGSRYLASRLCGVFPIERIQALGVGVGARGTEGLICFARLKCFSVWEGVLPILLSGGAAARGPSDG